MSTYKAELDAPEVTMGGSKQSWKVWKKDYVYGHCLFVCDCKDFPMAEDNANLIAEALNMYESNKEQQNV